MFNDPTGKNIKKRAKKFTKKQVFSYIVIFGAPEKILLRYFNFSS